MSAFLPERRRASRTMETVIDDIMATDKVSAIKTAGFLTTDVECTFVFFFNAEGSSSNTGGAAVISSPALTNWQMSGFSAGCLSSETSFDTGDVTGRFSSKLARLLI